MRWRKNGRGRIISNRNCGGRDVEELVEKYKAKPCFRKSVKIHEEEEMHERVR